MNIAFSIYQYKNKQKILIYKIERRKKKHFVVSICTISPDPETIFNPKSGQSHLTYSFKHFFCCCDFEKKKKTESSSVFLLCISKKKATVFQFSFVVIASIKEFYFSPYFLTSAKTCELMR